MSFHLLPGAFIHKKFRYAWYCRQQRSTICLSSLCNVFNLIYEGKDDHDRDKLVLLYFFAETSSKTNSPRQKKLSVKTAL